MRRTDNELYRIAMWETIVNYRSPCDETTIRELKEYYNPTKKQLEKILYYMDEIYQKRLEYEIEHYREIVKRKKQERKIVEKVVKLVEENEQ